MSNDVSAWAFKQKIPSSDKFVLVSLADNAWDNGICWPSVANIVLRTCLDRKTVINALHCLEANGIIADTGERMGRTKQIKVYRVDMSWSGEYRKNPALPPAEDSQIRNSSESGTVQEAAESIDNIGGKDSQIWNSSKNGTVPDFPPKGSQISVERLPNLGHGTIKEPPMEPLPVTDSCTYISTDLPAMVQLVAPDHCDPETIVSGTVQEAGRLAGTNENKKLNAQDAAKMAPESLLTLFRRGFPEWDWRLREAVAQAGEKRRSSESVYLRPLILRILGGEEPQRVSVPGAPPSGNASRGPVVAHGAGLVPMRDILSEYDVNRGTEEGREAERQKARERIRGLKEGRRDP